MKNYDLIMMSFDGTTVKDSTHRTIEEADEACNNLGSKWFFYPFPFIVSGSRIVACGGGLVRMSDKKLYSELMFKGRKLETARKVFKQTSEICDPETDCYQFEGIMIRNNKHLIRG
jgi:hypothetical protein